MRCGVVLVACGLLAAPAAASGSDDAGARKAPSARFLSAAEAPAVSTGRAGGPPARTGVPSARTGSGSSARTGSVPAARAGSGASAAAEELLTGRAPAALPAPQTVGAALARDLPAQTAPQTAASHLDQAHATTGHPPAAASAPFLAAPHTVATAGRGRISGRAVLSSGGSGGVSPGPDTTAPGPVTNLAALGAGTSDRLAWTDPSDTDLAGVTIRRAVGPTAPASPTAGTAVATPGKGVTSFVDSGLTAGTTYSYAVFARDAVPNYALAATVTLTLAKVVHVSGSLTGNAEFTADTLYVVDSDLTVAAGATLVVDAGTVVKVKDGAAIKAPGTLKVTGSASAPVTITSYEDDTVAGDTNGDGTGSVPVRGSWSLLDAERPSGGAAPVLSIDHAVVDFSSGIRTANATVSVTSSSVLSSSAAVHVVDTQDSGAVTVSNDTVSASDAGIDVDLDPTRTTAVPTVQNNAVSSINGTGLAVTGHLTSAAVSGNTESSVLQSGLRLAGVLTADSTVPTSGPIWVVDTLVVSEGTTLTVPAGVVMKVDGGFIEVDGTLAVQGTAASPVTITALQDDTVAGDTNGDGSASSPSAGSYVGITTGSGPNGSTPTVSIAHLTLAWAAGIQVAAGDGTVTGSTLENGGATGLAADQFGLPAATTDFENDTVSGGAGISVQLDPHSTSAPVVRNNTVSGVAGAAVSVAADDIDLGLLTGNTGSGDGVTGLVLAGTVTTSGSLPTSGLLVVLSSTCPDGEASPCATLTVASGTTVTVSAGIVVKAEQGAQLQVLGTLRSLATTGSPAVLTSLKDDTGGDTNDDGSATSPAAGDWRGVVGSSGTGFSDPTVQIRYAGG